MEKTKLKTLMTSSLVIMLFFIWPYFVNIVLGMFKIEDNLLVILNFFANFVLLALLLIIYSDSIKRDLIKLRKKPKENMKNGFKPVIIGFLLLIITNAILSIVLPNLLPSNDLELITLFKKIPTLMILMTLFYYPIAEEIVFKKTFKDIINNKWLFIILTAFLNAYFNSAFTIQNNLSYLFMIPNLFFSASISYAYYKTDNLVVPIIFRILYNLIPTIGFLINL